MGFLTKNIIGFDDRLCGVDLSDQSVKILQLEKDGRIDRIRSFSNLEIPRGYISDGYIVEKEKVAQILKLAIRQASPKKINTQKIFCSLPESKVFLRIITIPKMNPEEAKEAVKWELEASIPLSVDQVYFDWQFIDEAGGKQNVLTVSVAKEIVDNIIEVLEMADLRVYGLEVESVATVRSLIPKEVSKKDIFLIVDLGATRTSFIITEGNIPYFTSSIPFSSDTLTDIISKTLGVSLEEAEKMKLSYGAERSLENQAVYAAVGPAIENLIVEIEKTIDFYHNMKKNSLEVERVILSGGGSNLKGLLPYLATRLNKQVVIGDPWTNLSLGQKLPVISREKSLSFTTAIGLII